MTSRRLFVSLASDLSMAFLVLLVRLSPDERAAFLLRAIGYVASVLASGCDQRTPIEWTRANLSTCSAERCESGVETHRRVRVDFQIGWLALLFSEPVVPILSSESAGTRRDADISAP
jgi:hypothetical protein